MQIIIRRAIAGYCSVAVEDGSTRIDLGLLDTDERRALAQRLRADADSLDPEWEHPAVADRDALKAERDALKAEVERLRSDRPLLLALLKAAREKDCGGGRYWTSMETMKWRVNAYFAAIAACAGIEVEEPKLREHFDCKVRCQMVPVEEDPKP